VQVGETCGGSGCTQRNDVAYALTALKLVEPLAAVRQKPHIEGEPREAKNKLNDGLHPRRRYGERVKEADAEL
jgi:hypothetical protein